MINRKKNRKYVSFKSAPKWSWCMPSSHFKRQNVSPLCGDDRKCMVFTLFTSFITAVRHTVSSLFFIKLSLSKEINLVSEVGWAAMFWPCCLQCFSRLPTRHCYCCKAYHKTTCYHNANWCSPRQIILFEKYWNKNLNIQWHVKFLQISSCL